MKKISTAMGRREFLKSSVLAGGGMMIGFNWPTLSSSANASTPSLADGTFEINAYLAINTEGLVTIRTPNPEFGQNVKTSMPMIVAEELDVDWANVIVEMAPFDAERYDRQFTGGSQGIRQAWQGLRTAGAAARQMLLEAAAEEWQVPVSEVTASQGTLVHEQSGRTLGYGDVVSKAAERDVPESVTLKDIDDFSIVGTSRKNVDGPDIVSGKPLFTSDYEREGMLIAMIAHAPAFGMTLKSVDGAALKKMPGIRDVFPIKSVNDDYVRNAFDTNTFPELVAIVGETTWQVMKAKKALEADWEPISDQTHTVRGWGGDTQTVTVPAGLESTPAQIKRMEDTSKLPATEYRRDGDPEGAFEGAAKVVERTYTAPFLAHNCMEPLVAFADVTDDKAELVGPVQAPGLIEQTLSARLDMPVEQIDIKLARMGGGFGLRAYGHYMVEAALISKQVKAPVKLMYTREDDMTFGLYRPAYRATYRAALDADNNLIAYHLKAGGIPESPVRPHTANRFPAGAVDHCLVEAWHVPSNVTIAAFRAPGSNFLAGAEQSFLDEVAEAAGKDPIEFRLELLERAKNDPVGENNDYEPERYAGVLELVRDKSGWGQDDKNGYRGVSAYFCHNTYAAQVLDIAIVDGKPAVKKVCCAIDCGIVINPDAAANMAEGAIVDGIGNAFYGGLTMQDGRPDMSNFNNYRMIRMVEAPDSIDVYFVDSDVDPTGMGEPPFPPVFGAVANALYRATGERYYKQPFLVDRQMS